MNFYLRTGSVLRNPVLTDKKTLEFELLSRAILQTPREDIKIDIIQISENRDGTYSLELICEDESAGCIEFTEDLLKIMTEALSEYKKRTHNEKEMPNVN